MNIRVLTFLALLLLAAPAQAVTIYTYTGDFFGTWVGADGSWCPSVKDHVSTPSVSESPPILGIATNPSRTTKLPVIRSAVV